MKLVVFDMDQTLVDFINIHDETINCLFKEYFGVSARFTEIDYPGKTMKENFIEIARLKQVPEIQVRKGLPGLLRDYDKAFIKKVPENGTGFILPGVQQLLDALSRTDNIMVLYTGDSEPIVNAVMKSTRLEKYFRFFFFGSEVQVREDMIRLAIEKSRQLAGREFRGKNIVVVGDSVRDIEAGRHFGAKTIAVATGYHTREKLAAARPDVLFPNFADWPKVFKAIQE